jgi:cellulose synthase/poly-beta-1,6-N-acetylglucosamine synthase-like glycosyltransferase
MSDGKQKANLTVVVIGLNSAATLEGCLESVRSALARLGDGLRVLYVDGGSRDESVAIARRNGAEVIQLVTDRPTAAKGRNAGWRAATSPLIQFVDSDTCLEPDWLGRATQAIEADVKIACLFGQLRESNPTGSIYNEVCGCDWYIPPGDWRMSGGNALFRLEALREVGGSDEQLAAGEEPDLAWRLRHRGWRIVCIDGVMAHHDLAMSTFGDYWRRAVRSGYAYGEIGLRYARTNDPLWLREWIRNVAFLPVAALAAAAVGYWFGVPGLVAVALPVAGRLLWKFRSLRARIPARRLRALYLLHLAFSRIPLFWGGVKYLATRRAHRLEGR